MTQNTTLMNVLEETMAPIIPVSKDFTNQLTNFIETLQRLIDDHLESLAPYKVSYEMGTKYVKIVTGVYGNQSVHCFIDFSGNIYKANSWKAPDLKHIRGSIYDENCGVGTAVNIHGAIYLK